MNPTPFGEGDATSFEKQSTSAMVRINATCDRFEREWRLQQNPSLASFCSSLAVEGVAERRTTLLELVAIDVQHRRQRGIAIDARHYEQVLDWMKRDEVAEYLEQTSDGHGEAEDRLAEGQVLGDYLIHGCIGTGGMGQVYRAQHVLMGRLVAIKVLRRTRDDLHSQRRFEREVRSVACLSHENIVAAFDARREGRLLYLVTEWVEGQDLSAMVAEFGPLAWDKAIPIIRQAAVAMQYAHEQGIIHRDIKPSNVMVDAQGIVKVLDLGLAKIVNEAIHDDAPPEALTQSTQIIGTPAFIAPEQARSAVGTDARSDIYSLGCTAYYLLTGKTPFSGTTAVDMILSHASSPTPSVREKNESIPAGLSELIESMMAKSPDERPGSMTKVIERLDSLGTPSVEPTTDEPGISPASNLWHSATRTPTVSTRSQMVWAGIAFIPTMLLSIWFFSLPSRTADGVQFDGKSTYAQMVNFRQSLKPPILLEALVTPEVGNYPANIVSWTGNDCMFLFANADHRWGVGLLLGGQSKLIVSREPFTFHRSQYVAAKWDGETIELWIDGVRAETTPVHYELFPMRPSLSIGGGAPGLFPEHQGPRFFCGTIHTVRVSQGTLPDPSASASTMHHSTESTLVNLRFSSAGNVDKVIDSSSHHYECRVHRAE